MDEQSFRLGLFGVIHMDDPEKVTSELRSFVDGGEADAIFIEQADEVIDVATILRSFLRAPLYLFGLCTVAILVQGPLLVYHNRVPRPTEGIAVERLVEQRDLPVHGVDPTIVSVTDVGPITRALNWIGLAALAVFAPLVVSLTVATTVCWLGLQAVLLHRGHPYAASAAVLLALPLVVAAAVLGYLVVPATLFVGFTVFYVAVRQTLHARNVEMLSRTSEIAADNGYETGVLVTGKYHLRGLARLAEQRSLVVPAAHVSKWRDTGTRWTDFDAADLPSENGNLLGGDDSEEAGDNRRETTPRGRRHGNSSRRDRQQRTDGPRARRVPPNQQSRPPQPQTGRRQRPTNGRHPHRPETDGRDGGSNPDGRHAGSNPDGRHAGSNSDNRHAGSNSDGRYTAGDYDEP